MLVELRLDQPSVSLSPRPPRRGSRSRYRSAPTYLVAVCQKDGANRLAPSVRYEKSGRIRSTPRVLSRGNAGGVDDQRGPVGLEHGHVLADLTEAAERDDSGFRASRQSRRGAG
jgi:hypothetical protein